MPVCEKQDLVYKNLQKIKMANKFVFVMPAERYLSSVNKNWSFIKRINMLHIDRERTVNPYKMHKMEPVQYRTKGQTQNIFW